MMAYSKPQQRKNEETKRLRRERDQIKFIDLLTGQLCFALLPGTFCEWKVPNNVNIF